MFKINLIFKDNFHTNSRFLIGRARYETDSFVGAVMLIDALGLCCKDYSVRYGDHKFTPQSWPIFVKKNNPSDVDNKIVQPTFF